MSRYFLIKLEEGKQEYKGTLPNFDSNDEESINEITVGLKRKKHTAMYSSVFKPYDAFTKDIKERMEKECFAWYSFTPEGWYTIYVSEGLAKNYEYIAVEHNQKMIECKASPYRNVKEAMRHLSEYVTPTIKADEGLCIECDSDELSLNSDAVTAMNYILEQTGY